MGKRSLAFVLTTVLALSSLGLSTKADEITTSLKDKAGITPGSLLYPVDRVLETISLVFTFTDGSRIEKLMKFAEERVGESEVLIEKEMAEEAQKTIEVANELMEEAKETAEKAIEKSEKAEDVERLSKLDRTLQNLIKKSETVAAVLENLQEKTPEEIREALKEISEHNAARKVAVAVMVDARHALNDARRAYKNGEISEVEYVKVQETFYEAFNAKKSIVNKNGKGLKDFDKKGISEKLEEKDKEIKEDKNNNKRKPETPGKGYNKENNPGKGNKN
jgi:hypothetical protein